MLNDEELDNVAGGTTYESQNDVRLLRDMGTVSGDNAVSVIYDPSALTRVSEILCKVE